MMINTGCSSWKIKQFILYLFFVLNGSNAYNAFHCQQYAFARPYSSSLRRHDDINNHLAPHRPRLQQNSHHSGDATRGLTCFRPIEKIQFPHFTTKRPHVDGDDDDLLSSPPSSSASIGREELRQDEADILFTNKDKGNSSDVAWFESLPNGTSTGFRIIKQYSHNLPIDVSEDFDWSDLFGEADGSNNNNNNDVQRLELTPRNITLPVALMMADPNEYPSFSRARKACRKGNIVVITQNTKTTAASPVSTESHEVDTVFDPDRTMRRGRVGDRVFPGDILAKQVRVAHGGYYSLILSYKKPPFELPVITEDDHFALINKPAGVVVYGHHKGGHGVMTVRAALPFCLQPPRAGTLAILRRPTSVHRLDRATSGILCIAKTKPAMVHLSRQFHNRIIQKTYMAIINGIPQESGQTAISIQKAKQLGVDIQPDQDIPGNDSGTYVSDDDIATRNDSGWQLIDSPLDGKHAITLWRAIRYVPSLHAHDGYLTLVEMKPKTGRFHQLRRHMAWVCERPIVGDVEYDNNTLEAQKFRSRGMFLCSSGITLQHPFLNNMSSAAPQEAVGEKEDSRKMLDDGDDGEHESPSSKDTAAISMDKSRITLGNGGSTKIWRSSIDGQVMVSATIELPEKFESLLAREEERFRKFKQEKALCNETNAACTKKLSSNCEEFNEK
jgi:23S rRNA-/tRNA-specific pseudouridylate synthase